MFARTLARSALRQTAIRSTQTTLRPLTSLSSPSTLFTSTRSASHASPLSLTPLRHASTSPSNKSPADAAIDEITELYATAQDEFEIAMEETEKQTVYAQDDRNAAREEFDKMKEEFEKVVQGEDKQVAEEVQRRIGQRVRELEMGVKRLEEMAMEQD